VKKWGSKRKGRGIFEKGRKLSGAAGRRKGIFIRNTSSERKSPKREGKKKKPQKKEKTAYIPKKKRGERSLHPVIPRKNYTVLHAPAQKGRGIRMP